MRLKKPNIDKLDKAKQFAQGKKPAAIKNGPPEGATRKTMNVDEELYKRLKVRAAQEGKTIRQLLEKMIKAYLK